MAENFYIIYDGDPEDTPDLGAVVGGGGDEDDDPRALSPIAEVGRERRRRALESLERRRLNKIAARDEKRRALEEKRRERESEYARRIKEYQREKEIYRKQKEERKQQRKQQQTARVESAESLALQRREANLAAQEARLREQEARAARRDSHPVRPARSKTASRVTKTTDDRMFSLSSSYRPSLILIVLGTIAVLASLVMFGVFYPTQWYPTSDGASAPATWTWSVMLGGFVLLVGGNILAIPSVRVALHNE